MQDGAIVATGGGKTRAAHAEVVAVHQHGADGHAECAFGQASRPVLMLEAIVQSESQEEQAVILQSIRAWGDDWRDRGAHLDAAMEK